MNDAERTDYDHLRASAFRVINRFPFKMCEEWTAKVEAATDLDALMVVVESLSVMCNDVIARYGPDALRGPTLIEKLQQRTEERKH